MISISNVFIWSFHIYIINFKEKTSNTAKCLTRLGLMSLYLAVSLGFICIITSSGPINIWLLAWIFTGLFLTEDHGTFTLLAFHMRPILGLKLGTSSCEFKTPTTSSPCSLTGLKATNLNFKVTVGISDFAATAFFKVQTQFCYNQCSWQEEKNLSNTNFRWRKFFKKMTFCFSLEPRKWTVNEQKEQKEPSEFKIK